MRVGLTYDLRSEYLAAGYSDVDTAEFDQPETIDAIAGALARLGLAVERIGIERVRAIGRILVTPVVIEIEDSGETAAEIAACATTALIARGQQRCFAGTRLAP